MPQKSCDRKVNEVVKRVRALKVHLLLLQHLKKQVPALLFRQSAEAKILELMPEHFHTVWHNSCVVRCGLICWPLRY
jgi:EH domain-containing protein 1